MAAAWPALAGAQPGIERLLAQPASPVTEVLLVTHASDPRVSARWTTTLADTSPAVRAVVARAVQAAGATSLLPPLAAQLIAETDLAPAIEQAETLVVLSPAMDPAVRTAMERHGAPLVASVARALARRGEGALVAELSGLLAHGLDVELALTDVLGSRLEDGRPAVRLQTALVRDGTAAAWRVVVGASIESGVPLDAGRLSVALRSQRPEVSELALAYLLSLPDDDVRAFAARDATGAALDGSFAAEAEAAPSTRMLLTLLARRLDRQPPATDIVALAHDVPASSLVRRLVGQQLATLRGNERRGIERAWDVELKTQTGASKKKDVVGAALIGDLPVSLLHDALAAVNCRRAGAFGAVRVTYSAEGRAAAAEVSPDRGGDACREVFEALALMTRDDGSAVRTVYIPRDTAFLPGFAARPTLEPRRMPAWYTAPLDITPPALEHSESPSYSREAMKELVQGKVLLRVLVDTDGRVAAVRVQRSLHPDLDSNALVAMAAWRFTPASGGGQRVPIDISVEMGFVLK